MSQTLRSNFSVSTLHRSARRSLCREAVAERSRSAFYVSLETLMSAMQRHINQAKNELLQPRPQAVQFILQEAARLR